MSDPGAIRKTALVTVLAASLALNFLFGGFLLGRHLTFGPTPRLAASPSQAAGAGGNGLNAFGERLARLSELDRQNFQRAMAAQRPGLKRLREDVAESRNAVLAALAREPYDLEKTRQAFAELRSRTAQFQERLQDAESVALGTVSPEARRQLAGQ